MPESQTESAEARVLDLLAQEPYLRKWADAVAGRVGRGELSDRQLADLEAVLTDVVLPPGKAAS